MGCVNAKEEADDDNHLVIDGGLSGLHTCCSNCFSNGSECRSCSVVVLICATQKCSDCGEIHCSSCLQCDSNRQSDGLVCSKCLFLSSGQFMPRDLTAYSIRELRQFLSRNEITADHCKEKSDLIDLVMLSSSSSEYLANISEHNQHVQMLRERMLLEQLSDLQDTFSELQNESNSAGYNELPPSPIDAIQSVSIGSSTADGEKLSLSEAEEVDGEKETSEAAATDVSRDFCIYYCDEETGDHDRLRQTQNVSVDENIQTETESIATDESNAPYDVESNAPYDVESNAPYDVESSNRRPSATIENSVNHGKIANPLCRICSRTKTDCVFLECGHMVTCYSCSEQIVECPICFNFITRRVRAFRA